MRRPTVPCTTRRTWVRPEQVRERAVTGGRERSAVCDRCRCLGCHRPHHMRRGFGIVSGRSIPMRSHPIERAVLHGRSEPVHGENLLDLGEGRAPRLRERRLLLGGLRGRQCRPALLRKLVGILLETGGHSSAARLCARTELLVIGCAGLSHRSGSALLWPSRRPGTSDEKRNDPDELAAAHHATRIVPWPSRSRHCRTPGASQCR